MQYTRFVAFDRDSKMLGDSHKTQFVVRVTAMSTTEIHMPNVPRSKWSWKSYQTVSNKHTITEDLFPLFTVHIYLQLHASAWSLFQ